MVKKIFQGVVVSNKLDKTIKVLVERRVLHKKYKKYINIKKHFLAHDEQNVCNISDSVRIQESRPISKKKSWVFLKKINE